MFLQIVHGGCRVARLVGAAVRHVVHEVVRELRRVWDTHRRLLATNRAYGVALAGAAVELVSLTRGRDLLAALITAVLAIYAASVQDAQHGHGQVQPDFDWYDR